MIKKIAQVQEIKGLWTHHMNATHIITRIRYRIDLLVVRQMPSKTDINNKINYILKKRSKLYLGYNFLFN
jgi:hypothetical protein